MLRGGWAIGVVAIAVLICGGCTVAASGTPAPARVTLGPRPAELRLDGVDPCAILTVAQRAELGLDGGLIPYRSTFPEFGYPQACSIRGFEPRAIAVDFAMVTARGIEVVIGSGVSGGGFTDEFTAITVGGYPAVLARPRNPDFCTIDVDVAAGQLLEVTFADGGRKPPIPQEQLCRDVRGLAEAAMTSLLAG